MIIILFQGIIFIPLLLLSKRIGLLDIPNERKIHKFPTPYTGGILLSITYLFIVFVTNYNDKFLNLILSYCFLVSISGFIDDKYKINPGSKIVLQTLPIFLIVDSQLFLKDLGSYDYIGKISLGSFDKIFTILACLLLINAFNYTDGQDGLLTLISITIILTFTYILYINNQNQFEYLFILIFPLLFFLIFNLGLFKGCSIFLGDSGSNLLGFMCSFLSIYLYNEMQIEPAIIIWPLAYLVYEFLTVNIFRIAKRKGVFIPGNDHFHYELGKYLKINKYWTVLIISGLNLIFCTIGLLVYFSVISTLFSLLLYIIIFIIYLVFRYNLFLRLETYDNSS